MGQRQREQVQRGCAVGTVVLLAWLCRVLPLEGLPSGLQEACGILRSLLYLSLFAGWGISLYNRTVHPQVRRLLLNVDLLMLFWILVRTLRFQLNTPPGLFFVGRTARSGRKKQGCSTSLWGSPVWLREVGARASGFPPKGGGSARGFLFLRSLRVVFQVQLGHQLVADDRQHLLQLVHILGIGGHGTGLMQLVDVIAEGGV